MRQAIALFSLIRPWFMAFVMLVLVVPGRPVGADGEQHQRLEGSWRATITATTPPGLPPMQSLLTFTSDGTVIESRRLYVPITPLGSLLETTGHGSWVRAGHRRFKVGFLFLLQGAPDNAAAAGAPLGTDNIRMVLRLNGAGALVGTFTSRVLDNDDNVLFEAAGTVEATRIPAE